MVRSVPKLWWLVVLLLIGRGAEAGSISVYYSQAAWAGAIAAEQPTGSMASISLDASQWSSSVQYSPGFTGLLSTSNTAASNGMTVTFDSGFSAPGWAAFSSLGQVGNCVWTDNLSKYGSTTVSFGKAIYGLGGYFDIAKANGLYVAGAGQSIGSGLSGYDGFIGFVSDVPLQQILLSWGSGSQYLTGNSYTLSDLQVAVVPTPEPRVGLLGCGLVAVGFAIAGILRQHRKTVEALL